jgi:hypothetical protein
VKQPTPFSKDSAMVVLNQLADTVKLFPKKIIDNWHGKNYSHLYIQKELALNKYLEIGYEKFKGGKVAFYMHCRIPKKEADILAAQLLVETVINLHPKIEVYYNEDHQRDFNNGKVYDTYTHKVLEIFKPAPLKPIEEELLLINGGAEYVKKKYKRSIDYDFLYQTL